MLVTKTTLDAKAISEEVTSRFDSSDLIESIGGTGSLYNSLGDKVFIDADDLSNLVLVITADVINDINSGELI